MTFARAGCGEEAAGTGSLAVTWPGSGSGVPLELLLPFCDSRGSWVMNTGRWGGACDEHASNRGLPLYPPLPRPPSPRRTVTRRSLKDP